MSEIRTEWQATFIEMPTEEIAGIYMAVKAMLQKEAKPEWQATFDVAGNELLRRGAIKAIGDDW